jgi:hypothetical protein
MANRPETSCAVQSAVDTAQEGKVLVANHVSRKPVVCLDQGACGISAIHFCCLDELSSPSTTKVSHLGVI